MDIRFYRCYACRRVVEYGEILERPGCICGSMRVVETNATGWEVFVWTLLNLPRFFKILGEK